MGEPILRYVQVVEGKRLICDFVCGPASWWDVHKAAWQSDMIASLIQSAKQMGIDIAAGGLRGLVFSSKDASSGEVLEARVLAEKAPGAGVTSTPLSLIAFLSMPKKQDSVGLGCQATPHESSTGPLLEAISASFSRNAGVVSNDELRTELQSIIEANIRK